MGYTTFFNEVPITKIVKSFYEVDWY